MRKLYGEWPAGTSKLVTSVLFSALKLSVAPGDEKAGRALLYRLAPERFVDRVLLAWARSPATAHDPNWIALAGLPQRWTVPVFPLKAADFTRRGLAAGPALGVALRSAEQAWIEADFPVDRAAIEGIAERAARQAKASD